MSSRPTILIPTGFDPGAYACIKSLAKRGIHTIIASEYEDVPAFASKYCDEAVHIPAPYADLIEYRDALLAIVERSDVETIVPLRPHDPYIFSKYHTEFDEHVSLVTAPFETLQTVHDRLQLAEAAQTAGVPVPETRLLSDVDEWVDEVIIKSRYNLLADAYIASYTTRDSETVKSIKHPTPGEEPDVETIIDEMHHVPIVQEYIRSSHEYVFAALYDHGRPLATFQHKQIRGNSYLGGGGVYRESVYIPELEDVGRTLLDFLNWHGLACIEYMEDVETGEFYLTEINPRLWQSLPSAVKAGADFPYYYWQQAIGQPEAIDPIYELGVGTHFLYGEVNYLLSILSDRSPLVDRPSFLHALWDVFTSCCRMPYFDTFCRDDPRPLLRGFRHVVKSKWR